MNKFFFDDVRAAPDDTWTIARDVPEAKAILALSTFDVWVLDHDIGMQMMCDECYDEIPKPVVMDSVAITDKLRLGCMHMEHGTDLARWAITNILVWPELILIHSANWYGAERMCGILSPHTKCQIIPYEVLRGIDIGV